MGEESERQGMTHENSDVSHPRSGVRMIDGHSDNSCPLPLAFWRKRGGAVKCSDSNACLSFGDSPGVSPDMLAWLPFFPTSPQTHSLGIILAVHPHTSYIRPVLLALLSLRMGSVHASLAPQQEPGPNHPPSNLFRLITGKSDKN